VPRRLTASRLLASVVVVVAGGVVALVLAARWLAPAPALLVAAATWTPSRVEVRGAYHVHSVRSDGTGTPREIAGAAAAAGLDFVILTDHGNGVIAPDPPQYIDGVLIGAGVEISTTGGHYVALGLPVAPYPLAGTAVSVIEDVRRLRGVGIVAHAGSPRQALRWHDWSLPFDGLEWISADSEWRNEGVGELLRLLLTYPLRSVETLARTLDRPDAELDRWDQLTRSRQVPVLAAADAHARLGYRAGDDPYDDQVLARVPAYEVSFRAFSNHVLLDRPWTGAAGTDWQALLEGIARGRLYTTIDGRASGGTMDLLARSGARVAWMGDELRPDGPVTIDARVHAPEGATLVLLRDGEPVYDVTGDRLMVEVGDAPATYRVEVHLKDADGAPWLLTNPVYVGLGTGPREAVAVPAPRPAATDRAPVATSAWIPEASADSVSRLDADRLEDGTAALAWQFGLGGGRPDGQYAALRFPVATALARHDRVHLRARASRPMRVWVQLRSRQAAGGTRWGRSVYLDSTLRDIEVFFADVEPLDGQPATAPTLADIDALLLVVDTLNTLPATAGSIWITDLWLVR